MICHCGFFASLKYFLLQNKCSVFGTKLVEHVMSDVEIGGKTTAKYVSFLMVLKVGL